MTDDSDLIRQLRERIADLEDALANRLDDAPEGSMAWAVKAEGDGDDRVYRIVRVGGPAVAGEPASITPTEATIPASQAQLIGGTPPDGALALAVFASGFWTVNYGF